MPRSAGGVGVLEGIAFGDGNGVAEGVGAGMLVAVGSGTGVGVGAGLGGRSAEGLLCSPSEQPMSPIHATITTDVTANCQDVDRLMTLPATSTVAKSIVEIISNSGMVPPPSRGGVVLDQSH